MNISRDLIDEIIDVLEQCETQAEEEGQMVRADFLQDLRERFVEASRE